MIRRLPGRHGYALMLVLFFNVLFLSLLGVAWRRMASALRVASVRVLQTQRDEGSVCALGRAMRLLETGLPPVPPIDPREYKCRVTISTSSGPRDYTVSFTLEEDTTWTVQARPTKSGETPPPMPDDFAPSNP